jgi:hypothetical protein
LYHPSAGAIFLRLKNLKPECALCFRKVVPFVQFYSGLEEDPIEEEVRRFELDRAGFQCAGTRRPNPSVAIHGRQRPSSQEVAYERLVDLPGIPRYLLEL